MLDEGRKRDAAANAVLALSFAANAAQSPKDLVKSGHIEAPGVANMQRLMDPRKKRKDLDLQRVSHSARNRLRTETYDDETFRQHSKERPIDDQGYTSKSKTSSFLKKMKELNLSSEPTKKKKKTFKEFVEEAYITEAKGQPTFSSREDLEKHYKGIPKGMYANNAASSENPKWRLKPKAGGAQERKARAERIASLSSPEERKAADAKKKKLQRAGLEAHHITPTHYSAKIKASMSDAEWEARKKRDAADGIYHGHHHKNIMGATTEKTPESRRRRGIAHRAGGAHELEGKTRDIAHVGHKGLLAAAHKEKLRKEKEAKK